MSILTINDFSAPAPTTLSVQLEDARFSSHTALSGVSHISRAAVKRRVSVYWAHMEQSALRDLLTAVTQSPVCTLTFPDPLTGVPVTVDACPTQRSVGLQRMQDNIPVWTNIEMTFLES